MEDSFKHQALRRQLIDEIKNKGIKDEKILDAFNRVPRHFFLDKVFTSQAYSNIAFQIGAKQTISHPYTVAFQTSLLEVRSKMKILEIGTGSGFQTAILCALGAKVYSIERQSELYNKSKKILEKLGYTPKLFFGDGYKGKPHFAPYERILVTCGAPFVPQSLIDQLAVGGILVIPIGTEEKQIMTTITKVSETEVSQKEYGDFNFVPMLEKTNRTLAN